MKNNRNGVKIVCPIPQRTNRFCKDLQGLCQLDNHSRANTFQWNMTYLTSVQNDGLTSYL